VEMNRPDEVFRRPCRLTVWLPSRAVSRKRPDGEEIADTLPCTSIVPCVGVPTPPSTTAPGVTADVEPSWDTMLPVAPNTRTEPSLMLAPSSTTNWLPLPDRFTRLDDSVPEFTATCTSGLADASVWPLVAPSQYTVAP